MAASEEALPVADVIEVLQELVQMHCYGAVCALTRIVRGYVHSHARVLHEQLLPANAVSTLRQLVPSDLGPREEGAQVVCPARRGGEQFKEIWASHLNLASDLVIVLKRRRGTRPLLIQLPGHHCSSQLDWDWAWAPIGIAVRKGRPAAGAPLRNRCSWFSSAVP